MRTMIDLRDAERVVATAQENLRDLAFRIGSDDLLEVAQTLISVETMLKEVAGQVGSMGESLVAFDRHRDLADLDDVLVALRGFLALPDPGVLKIAGWSARAERQA